MNNIEIALIYISPGVQRADWLRVLMAVKSEYHESGYDIAKAWSQQSEKFNQNDFDLTWKSIKPEGGITIASLFQIAKENGYVTENVTTNKNESRLGSVLDIWGCASTNNIESHQYLKSKNVSSHGIKISSNGSLLVPIWKGGLLISLQIIKRNGDKQYLKDHSKKGGYHLIGKVDINKPLFICEGYATGATIFETLCLPVVVAFDAGNLAEVAVSIRNIYPLLDMTVCCDNDAKGPINTGIEAGKKAALKCDGRVVIPDLKNEIGSDFNDLALAFGQDEVKSQINLGLQNPKQSDVIFKELALLSDLNYEKIRKDKASELGVSIIFLDKKITEMKFKPQEMGSELVEKLSPYEGEVCGNSLLDEVKNIVTKHLDFGHSCTA